MINKGDHFKSLLLKNIYDGVFFVDMNCKIWYWNKGAEKITGYKADEIIGKRCRDEVLVHIDDRGREVCNGYCPLKQAIETRASVSCRLYGKHKEGHRIPLLVKVVPVEDENNEILGAVEIFSDNSEQKGIVEKMEELKKIAFIDHLTLLPNRRMVEFRLQEALSALRRHLISFGVCYLDIDNFKKVNDKYGHAIGDRVLKMVANTMTHAVRGYDMVGRWGGEEFLVLAPFVSEKDQLEAVGNRLWSLVRESGFDYEGNIINVTSSIGAVIARKEDTIDSLLKRADELMYMCKSHGRDRVYI
ncbi:MAG: sensor domain-containing diguanylate cyclase [Candidatus Eremiobacteraeota bacterium]|nr:sensor domain-containing diguanylate cyclase [Candidatus Eremiobacteraeota bacterium]